MSKSGVSSHQRERFLREHGFQQVRTAGGSHSSWEHTELRTLAKNHKVVCPPNLLHSAHQQAWEQPMCDDPARGTWERIVKHAKWCKEAAEDIRTADARLAAARRLVQEFKDAWKEVCEWKRDIRMACVAGLARDSFPAAPKDALEKVAAVKACRVPKPALS